MAKMGQTRYSQLFVYLLLFTSAKVRVYTGLAPQHHEGSPLPTRGAPPPPAPCEVSVPLIFFLAGKEFEGLLLNQQAWRLQRRRGKRRTVRSEHHFHSPATFLRPPPRSGHRPAAPSLITAGPFISKTFSARQIFFVVKGAGVYLALIYLQTIEKNPGPDTTLSPEQQETHDKILASLTEEITNVVKKNLGGLIIRLGTAEKHVKELQETCAAQETRINQLERQSRRNNVIIFGVNDKMKPEAALEKICKERLGYDAAPEYECAYRIGKKEGKKPILVKFLNQKEKAKIMANVKNLKGTPIVITDDLTPFDQAVRRTVQDAARVAKAKGITCTLRRTGLVVNENFIPAAELSKEAWMDEERSSVAGPLGPPAAAQAPKRGRDAIRTPPGGSQAPTGDEDFWGKTQAKKDKPNRQSNRSSSRNNKK